MPSKPWVGGSNPSGRTSKIKGSSVLLEPFLRLVGPFVGPQGNFSVGFLENTVRKYVKKIKMKYIFYIIHGII